MYKHYSGQRIICLVLYYIFDSGQRKFCSFFWNPKYATGGRRLAIDDMRQDSHRQICWVCRLYHSSWISLSALFPHYQTWLGPGYDVHPSAVCLRGGGGAAPGSTVTRAANGGYIGGTWFQNKGSVRGSRAVTARRTWAPNETSAVYVRINLVVITQKVSNVTITITNHCNCIRNRNCNSSCMQLAVI